MHVNLHGRLAGLTDAQQHMLPGLQEIDAVGVPVVWKLTSVFLSTW